MVLRNVPNPQHKYSYNTLEGLARRPDSTCPGEKGTQCEEGEAIEGKGSEKDFFVRGCVVSIVQIDCFVPGIAILVVAVIRGHFGRLKEVLSDEETHQESWRLSLIIGFLRVFGLVTS